MAFSGSQKTRLGLIAITRGLYSSFAGKAEAVITGIGPRQKPFMKNVARLMDR